MEPRVRVAVPSDASVLSLVAAETYVAAFGHSLSADDLRRHVERELSPGAFSEILATDVVLVAELSLELAGFVQFGKLRDDATPGAGAELRRLYVRGHHQNRGIGTRLMEEALRHSLLAGAQIISLDVWSQNVAAQRFYSRHGFRPAGERRFTVASGAETTPDIIMIRVAAAV